MAAQYGARVLNEVREERLDDFLADLRHAVNPQPRSVLGLPILDELLEATRFIPVKQDENLRQWFRLDDLSQELPSDYPHNDDSSEEISPRRDIHPSLIKPPVVEFTSSHSATGKTQLLYLLAAIAALPKDHGGKGTAVVWIDTEGRFSPSRLSQIIDHRVRLSFNSRGRAPTPLGNTVSYLTNEALKHIHVYRPQSSAQLISILRSLPTNMFNFGNHFSGSRALGLVILDSTTTYYWQDRFDTEMAKLNGDTHSKLTRSQSTTTETIKLLKELQQKFNFTIIFTTTNQSSKRIADRGTTLKGPNQSSGNPEILLNVQNSGLDLNIPTHSQWSTFATLSLSFSRIDVPQFAPSMTLAECLRDRAARYEAVSRNRFVVKVLSKVSGRERDETRRVRGEQQKNTDRYKRGFGFRVTDQGVLMEDEEEGERADQRGY